MCGGFLILHEIAEPGLRHLDGGGGGGGWVVCDHTGWGWCGGGVGAF